MKKKHIALLLAAAMTVTSLDATAMIVSAADFAGEAETSVELSDESTEEITAEPEQNEETEDTEAEISFEDPDISEDDGISGGVLRR